MKNKIVKRLVATTMCIIMAFSLSACGNTQKENADDKNEPTGQTSGAAGKDAAENVSITVYTEWVGAHPEAKFFSQRLEEFKQAYPNITVNVEELGGASTANMDAKLKIQISAGQLPDVFYSNDSSLVQLAKDEGLLYDMKDFFQNDSEYQMDLAEGNIETWNQGTEHVYSIAAGQDAFGFFYNKELLSKAGYDEFPKTWEEFWDCCDKLKANGIAPISLETKTAWSSSLTWFLLTAAQGEKGLELVNTMGLKDYSQPEMVKGAEDFQKLFTEYSTTDAAGADLDIAINHFLNEETAMIIDGPWRLSQFKDPENTSEGFADKLAVAMAPENGIVSYPAYAYCSGSKDGAKAKASYEFIKFFSNADAQKLNAELSGSLPSSRNIDLNEMLKDADPIQKEVVEFSSIKDYSVLSPWRVYTSGVITIVMQEMAALATGQETAQEFCDHLTEAAQ